MSRAPAGQPLFSRPQRPSTVRRTTSGLNSRLSHNAKMRLRCALASAESSMNIYTSNQLTTAIKQAGRSPFRRGFAFTARALASLALSPAAWAQCSLETLKGVYMSEQRGTLVDLPFTQVNRIIADENDFSVPASQGELFAAASRQPAVEATLENEPPQGTAQEPKVSTGC